MQSRQTRYAHVGPPWPVRSQRQDCQLEPKVVQRNNGNQPCCVMRFALATKKLLHDSCGQDGGFGKGHWIKSQKKTRC